MENFVLAETLYSLLFDFIFFVFVNIEFLTHFLMYYNSGSLYTYVFLITVHRPENKGCIRYIEPKPMNLKEMQKGPPITYSYDLNISLFVRTITVSVDCSQKLKHRAMFKIFSYSLIMQGDCKRI